MPLNAPDLAKQAPRSPRVRLGGYATLPRILDKGRATIAGTNGEYNYNCPMDQEFLGFAGVDAEAMKLQLAASLGDGAILAWIRQHQKHPRSNAEIAAWTLYMEHRAPALPELREFFNGVHQNLAPQRDDITTWFDLLDLDDYASFGGQP